MSFMVAVCGSTDHWGAPGLTADPEQMLEHLVGAVGDDKPATSAAAQASHLLVLTRPDTGPAMRRLATLLRAYDPGRHVAVLETAHSPLGMTLVAEHVNTLGLDPGTGIDLTVRLLDRTSSGWWVRRPGRVSDARPSVWHVLRSWFSKTGYVASGAGPVRTRLADAAGWDEALDGSHRLLTCGEVPEVPRTNLGQHGPGDSYARDLSWAGRAAVGQRSAFEWAAPGWGPSSHVTTDDSTPAAGAVGCDSCGARTSGPCPYCHASWGRLPHTSRSPEPARSSTTAATDAAHAISGGTS